MKQRETFPRSKARLIVVASAALVLGLAAASCGDDVVDDDVEREINEVDESIEDFVDTLFTDTTGG